MARRIVVFLLVLLTIGAVAAALWWTRDTADVPEEAVYNLVPLKRGPITAVVSATGTLSPVNTVQVGSQVSGTIQRLDADFNDRVEKGRVIAQIEPAIFKAKLAEAQANLENAQAQRDKAAVAVAEAKRELERVAELHGKRLAAASELDTARFAYDSAKVEHRVKEAAVAQARAALQREQVNLDYTTIVAPTDGVVVSRDVDVGQTVAASLQAPTLFTIANDLTRMQVEADVDESFIGRVREGQPVTFTVFAYPEREFHGEVEQVRLQPKVEAGVVKYNCIIRVDNADLALKPGMTATVLIEVDRREDAWQVPHAALRFVPDWPQARLDKVRVDLTPGQGIVWRADGDGVSPLKVSTGIVGEKLTEIAGPGLKVDLEIAVPGARKETSRRRSFGLSLF
ncbi:MAG: efflux RND transporter periplasmic adaptor subunit [Chromatiaceae bacterium]|jgi:HlyD family secretion protein|nr:efflux RND transporter periplasmic adaptor subunit [Chromatiaceae bacterium]